MILRLLEDGTQLLVMNTQYEDGGAPEQYYMRSEGCKIQLQKVEEISRLAPGAPVILMGDFNFHAWSEPYRFFMEHGFVDTYRDAGLADSADSSTFHGYQGDKYFSLEWGSTLAWRIDWILTRAGTQRLQTVSAAIVRDALPPLYPSDHYPVIAELLVLGP
jgi:endonuclease/exonuclease/phosphatase family metal-dependent hydrolase